MCWHAHEPVHATPADPQQDAAQTAEEESLRQKLQTVRDAFRTLQLEHDEAGRAHADLRRSLRADELKLAALAQELATADARIQETRGAWQALQARQAHVERDLARQRRVVAQLLRSQYQWGHHAWLRWLLAPESLPRTQAAVAYYQYLQRSRQTELARLRTHRASLMDLHRREIEAHARAVHALMEHRVHWVSFQTVRAQRENTLKDMAARLASQEARLAALQRDEQDLLQLLERLRNAIADVPERIAEGRAFSAQRTQLPWPVGGSQPVSVVAPSGRVQGVRIASTAGTRVQAVAAGRVAYADWFKGYGLLLIIEHGDGYMTLYAHNQALLKEEGEWVEAGEAVAVVGNSGGQARDGLYFEIRKQGQPLDPRGWLRARS